MSKAFLSLFLIVPASSAALSWQLSANELEFAGKLINKHRGSSGSSTLLRAESLPSDSKKAVRRHAVEEGSHLNVKEIVGRIFPDRGARSWVHTQLPGNTQPANLIVTSVKEKGEGCPYLIGKVVSAIKWHLGRRTRSSFISSDEAMLFSDLGDDNNGRDVLSNTMRVLGNYTIDEGIMAGSLWTIDDQNHYISCEQNVVNRLEEHTTNEYGDMLLQGDMAITSSLCHYAEESSKVVAEGFPAGTVSGDKLCNGVTMCQFVSPDEAVHFCNTEPDCTVVMGKSADDNCEGGMGCYTPRKGVLTTNSSWATEGGRTYVKHCPGALLEITNAVKQGLRDSGNRWENGEVAYCFTAEVTPEAKEAVNIAAKRIHEQVPCIQLTISDRVDDTKCTTIPSIIIQSTAGGGCWSYVGQVSGKEKEWKTKSQPLNLDRGCEMAGIAQHQLAHALGMAHENSRADRNTVLQINDGNGNTTNNIKEGKSTEFGMSQDVVKYAWSGVGECAVSVGTTHTPMTAADCTAIGGTEVTNVAAPSSENENITYINCKLDLCEDGLYRPAPTNICKERVAGMVLKMTYADCATARGTPEGTGFSYAWANCHFDLCRDMGLHLAKPLTCGNKLANGFIQVPKSECDAMGGSSVAHNVGADYVNCYFDFCSGSFDAPFDFLSLMMYSPHQWSKTGWELTTEPKGNYSEQLEQLMGQRMGFTGLDVFHLGHMYNCWEQINPHWDSKDVSRRILSGEFFERTLNGTCQDAEPGQTGFEIHGESGFMKQATCVDMAHLCKNESTLGDHVREACPVSCFQCMPNHGTTGGHGSSGPCFDAANTGIRFKEGPKATCKDLISYCNHTHIGEQVRASCKLTCGDCEPVVYSPFYDSMMACHDAPASDDPQFTLTGHLSECADIASFCQGHTDSYLVRHKCPNTCGLCGGDEPTTPKPHGPNDEIFIPGDEGGCDRRRRFGFCGTRRRRNI